VTNSVLHSGSAVSSGVVTVTVAVGDEVIRVEVTDRCGGSVPVLPAAAPADDAVEGSRGLWLVDALSARWGYERDGGLATTWFELCDLLQPMQHSAVSGKPWNPPDGKVPGS
jgi:anti-sigma regulatory factor (Ser/Thr protein kinase)